MNFSPTHQLHTSRMDEEQFQALTQQIDARLSAGEHLTGEDVVQMNGGGTYDTMVSILSQRGIEHAKAKDYNRRLAAACRGGYVGKWKAGCSLLALARDGGFSPCQLARRMLEQLLSEPTKQDLKWAMRDPGRLPSTRLRDEVAECVAADQLQGPRVDVIKQITGEEFEYILGEILTNAGVPFLTEDDLRNKGNAKTPDVKLEVPLLIDGHVVQWIDSKAKFGDLSTFKAEAEGQFRSYINRYGPGLVVYWCGFVTDLCDEDATFADGTPVVQPDVHVMDKLDHVSLMGMPQQSTTRRLNLMDIATPSKNGYGGGGGLSRSETF